MPSLRSHTRELLHKEALALITSANIAKNRAMKVTEATDLSEPEALTKYDTARAAILKSHWQLAKAKTVMVEKLAGLWKHPDGSTWMFPADAGHEDRKTMREDATHLDVVQKAKQLELYSAHGIQYTRHQLQRGERSQGHAPGV